MVRKSIRSSSFAVVLSVLVLGPCSLLALESEGASIPAVPGSPAVVRLIRDPQGGCPWLLLRNDAHPGGPGLMVRAKELQFSEATRSVGIDTGLPAVRAGDRLLVEEHTARADAGLEGVALEPARTGQILRVRIKANSGVVKALALAPGRVRLIGALPDRSMERP